MDIQPSFTSQLADQAARLAGTAPDESPTARSSFADTLARAAQEIAGTLSRGEEAAEAAVAGKGDAQQVVEALTATELALQTTVTVRDRVVEAYQQILRMPV